MILDSQEVDQFDGGNPLRDLRKTIACNGGHRAHLPFEMVLNRQDLDHVLLADTFLIEAILAKEESSMRCTPSISEEWIAQVLNSLSRAIP